LWQLTSAHIRFLAVAFAYVHDLLGRLAHDPQLAPEVLHAWLPDHWLPSTPPDVS
jgi:hypothetical protein